MKLFWSETSLQDRVGIFDYIADDNFAAAVRVDALIQREAERLTRFPALGRRGRVEETRELAVRRTPFVLVYGTDAKRVTIWRVLHGAMRWPPER